MNIKKVYRRRVLRIAVEITMLVLMLSGIGAAVTAPHEEWSKIFGDNKSDMAYFVQQTSDGGYVLAGSTLDLVVVGARSDALLIKTDQFGNVEWNKIFGGIGSETIRAIQQTSDGGYIFAGIKGYGSGGTDAWLVKIDSFGNEQWNRTFGGIYGENAVSVQLTSDGGYIFVGQTYSFSAAGGYDAWLVKTDAAGNEEWNHTFGGADNDSALSVRQTLDGGYVFAGYTPSFGAGGGDAWLIKTDQFGHELWNRTFGGINFDTVLSVKQTLDGGYVLAGTTNSFGAGGTDAWLIKTDPIGHELWNRTFGRINNEGAGCVWLTSDGGYILSGQTFSFGAGGSDAWLVKTDSFGNEEWNQTFGGINNENAISCQQTLDGGYIFAGFTSSYGAGYNDVWLVKVSNGTIVLPANLRLSENAPVSMGQGNTMTYSLYFNNLGDTALTGVTLIDTLSPNVEFISASDGSSYDPSTKNVTWNIDSVGTYPDGYGFRTVTVKIPTSVPVGTIIENSATISTADLELEYNDNIAIASTTVTGPILPPNVSLEPVSGYTGGAPSVHWTSPEIFSFNSSCATGVSINIHLSDGGSDITDAMTETAPGIWTYTTTFYPRHGSATVTYAITGCEETTVGFNIYIDPAGYVYDIATGERISGANVWLQQPDGSGGWNDVSTGQTLAVMQPDVNPLTTNAEGQYQWDVLPGIYRVHVEAPGYYPADSIEVNIPPPVTDLHVGLIRILQPDNTPPMITIDTPTSASYSLDQSVLANWQVTDSESGVKTQEATTANGSAIDTGTVGPKMFTVSAADNAGNEAGKTVYYNVIYNFSGILQPVNADGSSVFKLGSTVPVKFQLRDSNSNYVTSAVAKIYIAKISDGVVGTDMEAVSTSTATTGNQFRYDATGNQYIFNLATKPLTIGTWQIRIELNDGTSKYVNIGLK